METASKFLVKAVELDKLDKLSEALVCYQEGATLLFASLKSSETSDEAKVKVRAQIEQYLKRAEEIKLHLKQQPSPVKHEQIQIKDGQRGCSYRTLFAKYIDKTVERVLVEDPYLRNHRQLLNLLRFCEVLVLKASKLNKISIVTGVFENDPQAQKEKLSELSKSLATLSIEVDIKYSDTLHDRKIECNNGLIIKIGRGLDYFKATPSKFSIGFCDFDLRECQETTVDIYYKG